MGSMGKAQLAKLIVRDTRMTDGMSIIFMMNVHARGVVPD